MLLLSALAFFIGAVVVIVTSSFKNPLFWVLVGVGLFVLAGADLPEFSR